ncbi:MAG: type 4a pilus biogenesis protein PilO [Pseudomonadota bacterium]
MSFELNFDIKDLDPNDIGGWPLPVRILILLILVALVGGALYYFDTEDQLNRVDELQRKEQSLRRELMDKQTKASSLEAYKQQLQEMKETFGVMLRQLPNESQVADLLVDVSQTGLASGLEFELFQPQAENKKEFYAELPIQIAVNGSYMEFGTFVSGLAALPRIVTIHEIQLAPVGDEKSKKGDYRKLRMSAIAKTYRYLDTDTKPAAPKGAK